MTTSFKRHYDNIGEIIEAQHVNELQDVINKNEQHILLLKDMDFENYVLWLLKNRPEFNRLWIDTFNDTLNVDEDKTTGTVYLPKDRLIRIRSDHNEGEFYSKQYTAEENIKEVQLVSYSVRPDNTDTVKIQISINGLEWEDLPEQEPYTPIGAGKSFQLRARLGKTSPKGPTLYRWALLWR